MQSADQLVAIAQNYSNGIAFDFVKSVRIRMDLLYVSSCFQHLTFAGESCLIHFEPNKTLG